MHLQLISKTEKRDKDQVKPNHSLTVNFLLFIILCYQTNIFFKLYLWISDKRLRTKLFKTLFANKYF
jgi:hypothetical protein